MKPKRIYNLEELLPDIRGLEKRIWPDGFDNKFGVYTYYADYISYGLIFKPRSILEIGVRYGYSAIAMAKGSFSATKEKVYFQGIDSQLFADSNAIAFSLMTKTEYFDGIELLDIDTQVEGISFDVLFDLIHVDAEHATEGCLNDLRNAWKCLRPGGVLIADDYKFKTVRDAVNRFVTDHTLEIEDVSEVENERNQALIIRAI